MKSMRVTLQLNIPTFFPVCTVLQSAQALCVLLFCHTVLKRCALPCFALSLYCFCAIHANSKAVGKSQEYLETPVRGVLTLQPS